MRSEPMIAARDVQASAAWYCQLFEADHDHDGDDFDRILKDGQLLLMLHQWGTDEHGPALVDPGESVGNGFVLWFLVSDLDPVYERAVQMGATIHVDIHENPVTHWREFTLADPDGYALAIAETGWD